MTSYQDQLAAFQKRRDDALAANPLTGVTKPNNPQPATLPTSNPFAGLTDIHYGKITSEEETTDQEKTADQEEMTDQEETSETAGIANPYPAYPPAGYRTVHWSEVPEDKMTSAKQALTKLLSNRFFKDFVSKYGHFVLEEIMGDIFTDIYGPNMQEVLVPIEEDQEMGESDTMEEPAATGKPTGRTASIPGNVEAPFGVLTDADIFNIDALPNLPDLSKFFKDSQKPLKEKSKPGQG